MRPEYTPVEMATEWRVIPGWEMYEVSDWGHVRRSGTVRKPWKQKNGRWQVRLCDGSRTRGVHTYRLVCEAFHGPKPFPKAVVAHRDDNLDNNHKGNVRWTTNKENGEDKVRNGRCAIGLRNGAYTCPEKRPRGEASGGSKLREPDVIRIRASCGSSRTLARQYGVSKTTVLDIKRRKIWRHI